MASLLRRTGLTGFAFILAVSLTALSGLIAPLAGDESANQLLIPAEVLADEAHGGGG